MLGRVFLEEGILFKEEQDRALEVERILTSGNTGGFQENIHHNFPSTP